MDLQDEFAAHCLVLLSRKTSSRNLSHPSLIHLREKGNDRPSLSLGHHFQSCSRQQADSTGDFSASDRQSPSSSSDCSLTAQQDRDRDRDGTAVSQSGGEPADEAAVDLSGFRTRTTAAATMRQRTALLPDHRRIALMTHKVNDDLYRQQRPSHLPQQAQHVLQVRPDRAAGSLSDHSPFMIARIMTDLNQYRQQDPGLRLTPDSETGPTVRVTAEEAAATSRLRQGSHSSASRVPDSHSDPGSGDQGTGAATHISTSADTPEKQASECREKISAASPPIRKKRKAAHRTVASKKRQQKQLSEVDAANGSDDADERDETIDCGTGISAAEKGSDLLAKCERQCKHACAFPGCDKVYGKKEKLLLSSRSFVLLTQSPRNRRSHTIISSPFLSPHRKVFTPEKSLSEPYGFVFAAFHSFVLPFHGSAASCRRHCCCCAHVVSRAAAHAHAVHRQSHFLLLLFLTPRLTAKRGDSALLYDFLSVSASFRSFQSVAVQFVTLSGGPVIDFPAVSLQVRDHTRVIGSTAGSFLLDPTNWLVTTEHIRVKRTSSVPTATSASCDQII